MALYVTNANFTCVNLRPCYVKCSARKSAPLQKGLFHGWAQEIGVVGPGTVALVEFEDGHIKFINPSNIRFCDDKFKEYAFGEEEDSDGNQG